MTRAAALMLALVIVGCPDDTEPAMVDDAADATVVEDSSGGAAGADVLTGPCTGAGNGDPCDDGDPCTLEDQCASGQCVGGTNDPCDAEGGCRTGTCEPGVGCSYSDIADDTVCQTACFTAASCIGGECVANPAKAVSCPAPSAPCVDSLACDTSTGQCTIEILAAPGTACNSDSDVCTAETCDAAGTCGATGAVDDCKTQLQDNPCWTWTCNKTKGCIQTLFVTGASCDDNNPCTLTDLCIETAIGQQACLGTPVALDDANPCTSDACVDGVVTHKPVDGVACAVLGDPCSDVGLCEAGSCVSKAPCECSEDADCPPPANLCGGAMVCDPSKPVPVCVPDVGSAVLCAPTGNPCVVAFCDPGTGECTTGNASEVPCDDGDQCTVGELCDNGVCSGGQEVNCPAGSSCQEALCTPGVGCHLGPSADADGQTCDDGDACTTGDVCNAGLCLPMSTKQCEDSNPCGASECVGGECVQTPLSDGTPCFDGDPCTGDDACFKGQCTGVGFACDDGLACTLEVCSGDQCLNKNVLKQGTCKIDGACHGAGDPSPESFCQVCSPAVDGFKFTQLEDGSPCGVGGACKGGLCLPQLSFLSLSDLSDPHRYLDVSIDPGDPTHIVALTFDGRLASTDDSGETWTWLCTALGAGPAFGFGADYNAKIVTSGSQTWLTVDTRLMQVIPINGASCPLSSFGAIISIEAGYPQEPIALAPSSGLVYAMSNVGALVQATETFSTDLPGFATPVHLAISPTDEDRMLVVWNDGIYRTSTNKLNWNLVVASGVTGDAQVRFDDVHSGFVIATTGRVSTDDGKTWSDDPAWATEMTALIRGGAGYRLATDGLATWVERAADATDALWLSLDNTSAPHATGRDDLDVRDQTITTIVGHRLRISTDGGETHTLVGSGDGPALQIDWVDGEGLVLYAADAAFRVYRSDDGGGSFSHVWDGTPGWRARLLVNPFAPDHALLLDATPSGYSAVRTADGFKSTSAVVTPSDPVDPRAAFSASDPSRVILESAGALWLSTDGGAAFSALTLPQDHLAASVVMQPGAPAVLLYTRRDEPDSLVRLTDGQPLELLDDVAPALGKQNPAGLAVSGGAIWAIGETGTLARSLDGGDSWAAEGTESPGMQHCPERRLRLADDSTIISWCQTQLTGKDVHVTSDGGQTWSAISYKGDSPLAGYGCPVPADPMVTPDLLIRPCEGRSPVTFNLQ